MVEEVKKKEKVRRGVNTLETNIKKLDLSKYEIDSDVDPLFSVMTKKFNDSTVKGLLLNTIPLDERINYILESKQSNEKVKSKVDSKIKEKEKEKEEKNEEKKKEDDDVSMKEDNSDEESETKKIKDALNLANNLQKKDESDSDSEDEVSRVIPVTCTQDFEKVRESIKKVLKSFIKDNTIDDFIHLQICPDLNAFRESRKLNTEETNLSFINTFKEEINQADKKLAQGDFEENASIMDEEEQENLVEAEEELADNQEDKDYDAAEENENKENADPNVNNANFNPKGNENGLTVFKYEDLIERAGQFGTGNTQNLPQFMNFSKNFGKLEKNSFFNKGSMLGLKKEAGVKKKKEEKNFLFDESNEVNLNDLFTDMNPKILSKVNDNSNDYEKRRKVKCFFNFDKLSQFKLFTITGKTITSKDIDNDLDINQQEKNLESNKVGNNKGEENIGENEKENEIIGFEKNNEYDSFYQSEKKAEKNFVKLYRKFDIRALKKKIWNSYEEIKEPKIDFKSVVVNMSKNMTEEEIFSISTPTCFVCMLHLCNEKNLFIEQKDMNTFYIERDPDGNKSANYTGRNIRLGDDSSSDSD